MTKVINREELAWAAGFFDGEGHCSGSRRKGDISMNMAQVDPRPLGRFHAAIWGLGKFVGPNKSSSKNGNEFYIWRTTNHEHVQAIVAMLWTFLSEPKREQVKHALVTWNSQPHRIKPQYGPYYERKHRYYKNRIAK
jgi:hypothetical protein